MNLSDSTSHCAGGSFMSRLYRYQTVRLYNDMTKPTCILYRRFTDTGILHTVMINKLAFYDNGM